MSTALAEEVIIPLGKTHTLKSAGSNVHVGSKSILQIVDAGDAIKIIGKKIGETYVSIGSRAYQVHVVSPRHDLFYKEVTELMRQTKGLYLGVLSGRVRITGRLYRWSDWQAIQEIAQRLKTEYDFAAQPLSDVAKVALNHFSSLAETNGLPTPKLVLDPDLVIKLPAGTESLLHQAEQIFSSFGLRVRLQEGDVKLGPLVRTNVILAELSRTATRAFGVGWPQTYQTKILPNIQYDSLAVELKSMESKGVGRVLASPNLLCRSGGTAEFLAGGEIPIKTGGKFFGGEVKWKKHGVSLNIKPSGDFTGALSVEIETEVSLLDKANAIEGIPGLKTNRVKSHFDLLSGKTIVLSGLLREDWGRNREGLAGLASIPILGLLFSSQNFQSMKSELVIFVTPQVLRPTDSEPMELPSGWANDDL